MRKNTQLSKSFSLDFSKLVSPKKRVLIAVSGGLDSVVLLDLLTKYGLNEIAVVHCNFQLRGKNSDEDEYFVEKLAQSYGIKFFCKRFDTRKQQKKSGQSIQMIARDLRYSYFFELLQEKNYDYLAVAHHADDQIETFFINLLRSSGIKGLRGMLPKREQIIRPLLNFSKQELKQYAQENLLQYREDATNSEDYYLRNKIRHHLLPCLETLDKSAKKSILQTIENLQNLEKQSLQDLETLQNSGFSATQIRNMYQAGSQNSGKQFVSKTHRAITHHGKVLIEPVENSESQKEPIYTINVVDIRDFELNHNPNIAQLDLNKINFPLTLRHWKKGDSFIPFGQRGKQKLSDFFINRKLSRFEKERVWILCSNEQIVWIIGHQIDNRYRISSETKRVLVVSTKTET